MILRRLTANLKSQNWTAIAIEFVIVVLGVFIGTQVANWNQQRIEDGQIRQMLQNLKPELKVNLESFDALENYYARTRRFAESAFAGWDGDPRVSDRDFVIAAYQASQNSFTGLNNGSWSQAFGSDQLRGVRNQPLRTDLGLLMSTDYIVLEQELFTDYRRNVRQIIPEDIQDAIRSRCGDRRFGVSGNVRLPDTCNLDLPEARFADAAKMLRAHPELVGQLRWHFAAVATYVDNVNNLEMITRRAARRIQDL